MYCKYFQEIAERISNTWLGGLAHSICWVGRTPLTLHLPLPFPPRMAGHPHAPCGEAPCGGGQRLLHPPGALARGYCSSWHLSEPGAVVLQLKTSFGKGAAAVLPSASPLQPMGFCRGPSQGTPLPLKRAGSLLRVAHLTPPPFTWDICLFPSRRRCRGGDEEHRQCPPLVACSWPHL